MKHYCIVIVLLFVSSHSALHSDKPTRKIIEVPVQYALSGYIKFESYADTRQVVGSATDQTLLFPEKKLLDPLGRDKNGNGQLQMVALESRLALKVFNICNWSNTQAEIEGDFVGTGLHFNFIDSSHLDNVFRLRHAFIQFDWPELQLLFGQTWSPTFTPDCYADTVSFNNGSPFDIYSRNPQVKLTLHCNHLDFIAMAASQIKDFASPGVKGYSTDYIRNAIMPNFHAQIRGRYDHHAFGIGYDVKRLKPRLQGDPVGIDQTLFAVSESLISNAVLAYYTLFYCPFKISTKVIYGQNTVDMGMLGGYAIQSINPITDEQTYTNIRVASIWTDIVCTAFASFEPGLFFGYTKNLGTQKTIDMSKDPHLFALGEDIDMMWRIAPRCRWRRENITFAAEIEYTAAAFGTFVNRDNKSKVINSSWVDNIRALFAVYYFF